MLLDCGTSPSERLRELNGRGGGRGTRVSGFGLCRQRLVVPDGRKVVSRPVLPNVQIGNGRYGALSFVHVCGLNGEPAKRAAAAKEILDLGLPIVGLIHNAGIQNPSVATTAEGWDMTFVTNHLRPFALTEGLVPHLEDGASVLFLGSATEDPERKPTVERWIRAKKR
jgi:NAD(P)-dependent dehydrogenase (short-subunit alcohol dehydrogenase family)